MDTQKINKGIHTPCTYKYKSVTVINSLIPTLVRGNWQLTNS